MNLNAWCPVLGTIQGDYGTFRNEAFLEEVYHWGAGLMGV